MADSPDIPARRPRLIEDRSSRVIAVCRLGLALVFGLAIAFAHKSEIFAADNRGEILLFTYLVFAVVLLPIAWNDWWLDFRLAPLTFAIDSIVFVVAIYITQSPNSDFISPLLAFSIFLMLTAINRWNWRFGLIAAVLLAGSYMAIGAATDVDGLDVDDVRLFRRVIFMVVVSLMLIWFGLHRQQPRALPFDPAGPEDDVLPLALRHAMNSLGANCGAIAWADADEPRVILCTEGDHGQRRETLAPNAQLASVDRTAMLFADEGRRMVARDGEQRLVARKDDKPNRFARHVGMTEGLSVPLFGETGEGQLLLSGIPGLSRDDIARGEDLAREIAAGIDRAAIVRVSRETDLMRLRGNLARDLHDSVAQSLAGASFRLQALRAQIAGGADPIPEIDAISHSLRNEQAHVRGLIEQLRRGEVMPTSLNLVAELHDLLAKLAEQWGIATTLDCPQEVVTAPAVVGFDVQQIVREGVANAVRHGGANTVRLELVAHADGLALTIADNGSGFAANILPRSLSERVGALSGTLAIASQPGDTRLQIRLPGGGHS